MNTIRQNESQTIRYNFVLQHFGSIVYISVLQARNSGVETDHSHTLLRKQQPQIL